MDAGSARGRSWPRWARVLVVGLVLGAVQILLTLTIIPVFTESPPVQLPLALVVVLSACSYLMVSLIEGFLAASRKGTISSGIDAANLAAGISVLTIAIPTLVLAALVITAPRPQGGVDDNDFRPLIALMLLLFIVGVGLWAWVLSTLGGWIGGHLGRRGVPRSNQGSAPTAPEPL